MAETASDMFEEMLDDVIDGRIRCVDDPQSPMQERTVEASFCQQYVLKDIHENVPDFRKIDETWAIANVLHFFSETEDAEVLRLYNRHADRFIDRDGKCRGAYGAIAMPQVSRCIGLLRAHPATRRAVVSMGGLEHNDINRPACWSFLHFMQQDGKLHLGVYQRSLNLFRVMPYDCILLTNLLNYVAYITASTPGSLHWTIGSLHMGEHDAPSAAVVQRTSLLLPPMHLDDGMTCYRALYDRDSIFWRV